MQSSRLLSIPLKLQTQGRISAQALAQSFEVSVRTIYRDIDALSAAGVPVLAEKGRSGGFELRAGSIGSTTNARSVGRPAGNLL